MYQVKFTPIKMMNAILNKLTYLPYEFYPTFFGYLIYLTLPTLKSEDIYEDSLLVVGHGILNFKHLSIISLQW
jgi:hypothetical protein